MLRALQVILVLIALEQLFWGLLFLFAPVAAAQAFGLPPPPPWVHWFAGLSAAHFLAFAFGMALAARDPRRHVTWIQAMIIVAAVEFLASLYYFRTGAVTFDQAGLALILPPVFIVLLSLFYPRARARA